MVFEEKENLVFITNKNQAKRINSFKLPISSRITKGTRINKTIKSNPQSILWFERVSSSDKILITTQDETKKYEASQIPLLDVESGNNKFMKPHDIFYYACITKTNTTPKRVIQKPKKDVNPKKPSKIINDKNQQIDLFDILDDI